MVANGPAAIYTTQNGEDALVQLLGLSNVPISNGNVVTAGNAAGQLVTPFAGLGGFHRGEFLLIVSAAATDVADTLDVFIDGSNDDGSTWVNLVHFTQILGNGGAKKIIAILDDTTGLEADVTADLAAGATPRAMLGDRVRVRWTTAGDVNANSAFTFNVVGSFRM